jgi:putative phosphonate metabolism protein
MKGKDAMPSYPRFAIYFTPPREDALCRLGAATLGYDAFSGEELPFPPALAAACPDWRQLTEEPRKYGFHATLKAPFALADGCRQEQLLEACRRFAETPRRLVALAPEAQAIGDFVALVPREPSFGLNEFAQDCVEAFDRFRAPLTESDRARRQPAQLSPRQRANLEQWGYPFVEDDFRFHMTLAGRIPAARRGDIARLLRDAFAEFERRPLLVDRIAVFRQDAPTARFRIVASYPLRPDGGA